MRRIFTWLLPLLFVPLYLLSISLTGAGHGSFCLIIVITFPWCGLAYWLGPAFSGSPGVLVGALGLVCLVQYGALGHLIDRRLFGQGP